MADHQPYTGSGFYLLHPWPLVIDMQELIGKLRVHMGRCSLTPGVGFSNLKRSDAKGQLRFFSSSGRTSSRGSANQIWAPRLKVQAPLGLSACTPKLAYLSRPAGRILFVFFAFGCCAPEGAQEGGLRHPKNQLTKKCQRNLIL